MPKIHHHTYMRRVTDTIQPEMDSSTSVSSTLRGMVPLVHCLRHAVLCYAMLCYAMLCTMVQKHTHFKRLSNIQTPGDTIQIMETI